MDHLLYPLAQNGQPMVDFVLEFRELAKTSSLCDSELRVWFLGGLDNQWYSRMPKNLLTNSLTECMYYALQLSRSTPSGPSSKSSHVMAANLLSSPIMATSHHPTWPPISIPHQSWPPAADQLSCLPLDISRGGKAWQPA